MRKAAIAVAIIPRGFSLAACRSGFPYIAMSPTKPLDVVILMKNQDRGTEDSWEPYQEYGERTKGSTNDWSCFILTKEGEVSVTSVSVEVPCSSMFQTSNSQSDARIQQRNSSQFGYPSTHVTSNNISSVPKARLGIR